MYVKFGKIVSSHFQKEFVEDLPLKKEKYQISIDKVM